MLQKSSTNPAAPLLEEGKPRGAKAPVTRPNSPDSTANRVILSEGKPAGRSSSSSTFTAPRKEGGSAPFECGYTHLGKM